jgi:RNA polymerase sigma-70 factor (ECF subfamily)
VQETLIRAWEKRATFTTPGSFRAWLYRIATNLCLNMLTRAPRRSLPPHTHPATDPARPFPPPQREPIWLEPFPDDLLADQQIDPEYCTLQRESTTLAFLVALQQLTPAQRAILLLREVLDWPTSEVAEWLNLSVPAVKVLCSVHGVLCSSSTSPRKLRSLSRPPNYRRSLSAMWPSGSKQISLPGLVGLLREDAWFTMPPSPAWFQGREAIATFFHRFFAIHGQWRLSPTHANASPAFGLYRWDAGAGMYQLFGLLVLGMMGEQIANMVTFGPSCLSSFGLPATFPSSYRSAFMSPLSHVHGSARYETMRLSEVSTRLEEKEPHDLGQSAVLPVTRARDSDATPTRHSPTGPQ